jgi:spore maturation protein A
MVMSWIFTGILLISLVSSLWTGQADALSAAVPEGAQAGIALSISLAGSLCLWSGVGRLMEQIGVTGILARLLRPLLERLFPGTRQDPVLAGHISSNICANFLGLGNAATPMGIRAVQRMVRQDAPQQATDQMCRFIVLNTASIQLIPANVAAVRVSLGCATPFDILPAVWFTSICSAGIGLLCSWFLGKLWTHD